MASGTCRYSFECNPLGYSKCPSRSAPVSRSTRTTSSWVGVRCIGGGSVGSLSRKHARDGQQQYLPIERERPVVDVLHIHFHPRIEIQIVASGHGPQTGQAGTHAQPAALPALIMLHL